MSLSQIEIVGACCIGLAAILALVKYFTDYVNKQNEIYSKFNENLVKNTLAIDNLNKLIEKMEKEIKERLDRHEERLDNHDKALLKLERGKTND